MSKKLKATNQPKPQKNDHFQKPPTNAEMIGELQRHMQQMYRIMGEMNTRLIAVCQAKVTPEVMAKFILEEAAQDAYMKNINLAIDAEIERKNAERKPRISEETAKAIDGAKL